MRICLVALVVLLASGLIAGEAQLVKDVNTTTVSSRVSRLENVAGTIFFTKWGSQLWKTAGTEETTTLVADLRLSGQDYWTISTLTAHGELLLFFVSGGNGRLNEIWRSDGTKEGTYSLKTNFDVGEIRSNGKLAFLSSRGRSGSLWKTDGTKEGTVRLKQMEGSDELNGAHSLTFVGDSLLFSDPMSSSLWKSDGTEAGTLIVFSDEKGFRFSSNPWFTAFKNRLYFVAGDNQLWVSDGTNTGTTVLDPTEASAIGKTPSNLTVSGDSLFYSARDEKRKRRLFVSDGTVSGTAIVVDEKGKGPEDIISVVALPDRILAYVESSHLWVSNGSPTGTKRLENTRYIPRFRNMFNSDDLVPIWATTDESVYFCATEYGYGAELWKSDGTDAGTVLVKDINPGTESSLKPTWEWAASKGNTLFFPADDGLHGMELWRSDGSEDGTSIVKDISTDTEGSAPDELTVVGSKVLFMATGTDGERKLWASDTETGTTTVVSPKLQFPTNPSPTSLLAIGSELYFVATDTKSGMEVWVTDGTESGTRLLKDIAPAYSGSNPSHFVSFGDSIYFVANDGKHGRELWTSDGTETGTHMLKDIFAGAKGSEPFDLTSSKTTLMFFAKSESGFGLWTTDGSAENTKHVTGTWRLRLRNPTFQLTENSGSWYFVAPVKDDDYQLWYSDGTTSGTSQLTDSATLGDRFELDPERSRLIVFQGKLCFTAVNRARNFALMRVNGSAIEQIAEFEDSTYGRQWPKDLVVCANTLYLANYERSRGWELWMSNGTTEGTRSVLDLCPGRENGLPGHSSKGHVILPHLQAIGGTLFLIGRDKDHTFEIWKTDGTEEGTQMITDFGLLAEQPGVTRFWVFGDMIYFRVNDGKHGLELWKISALE